MYITAHCSVPSAGALTGNRVAFASISQGPHTFAVVAMDNDGLGERSEVHFEGKPPPLSLCCNTLRSLCCNAGVFII